MGLEMKRQDLEELYLLLEVYERTYGGRNVREMKEELSAGYGGRAGGIFRRKAPQGAGRKRQHTEEEKKRIRELRNEGMAMRKIAEETGCSVGYVQGVLRNLLRTGVQ